MSATRYTTIGLAAGLLMSQALPRVLPRVLKLLQRLLPPTNFAAPTADQFSAIDTVIFDCDGVLYLNKSAVSGASAALNALRSAGKRLLFVTNAATVSRAGLAAKLTKMGFEDIAPEDCVTSASAAAAYLQVTRPDVKAAYVVGAGGLVEELAAVGIESVGPGTRARHDANASLDDMVREGWSDAKDGAKIGAVVVGMLNDGLGYAALAKASAYARNRSRAFVATNEDAASPLGFDVLLPAGGTMATAVAYGAERRPDVWVGKPSRDLAQLVVRTFGLTAHRTLMVGDRTNTDVVFGRSVGMRTCLVLSGCHTVDDARAAPAEATPEFVAGSVVDLAKALPHR